MNKDGLTILDLEQIILKGQIVQHQKDSRTGENKYLIQAALSEVKSIAVVKITLTGHPVVITVYCF